MPQMRTADSSTEDYRAKAEPGTDRYKTEVAEKVMEAFDQLPPDIQRCVHDFGYVDVYRAWKRGWSAERIRQRAKEHGGRFVMASFEYRAFPRYP